MNNVWRMFEKCAEIAMKGNDSRNFILGAIGVRADGAQVSAHNAKVKLPFPPGHAERRLIKKLDFGSTVYVVRITSLGDYAIARPCGDCLHALRHRRVKRIFYTIGPREYGVIDMW